MWMCTLSLALAAPEPSEEELRFARFASRFEALGPLPERGAGYHATGELWGEIARVVQGHPGIFEPEHIGNSVDGQPIWAVRAEPVDGPARIEVVVVAQLHALEFVSAEVALSLLQTWAEHPPRGVAMTVVPVANPDGRWRVEQDLRSGAPKDTYRRANSELVDLNRDYAVHREPDTWLWPRLPITRGFYEVSPAPLSQPETQAIAALLDRIQPDDVVDLHAPGGYILVPWAGRYERSPEYAQLMEKATAMQEAMPGRPYRAMQLCHWTRTFRALGALIDHAHASGSDAFLVELGTLGARQLGQDKFRYYNPKDVERVVADGTAAVMGLVRFEEGRARGLE
ncbi:MAG: M14 family metallopeptidase [Myxococcota bacterium]|nr:M14 family metallopeptidase [Myxococcota bacterium]